MKKLHRFIPAVLIFCSLFLTGCGTKLLKLTDEQEKAVVAYSAAAVSKYNKNQEKGITGPPATPTKKDDSSDKDKKDKEDKEDKSTDDNKSSATENPEQTSPEGDGAAANKVSLNDALQLSGVTIKLVNSEVRSVFNSTNYYSLMPEKGKEFLVLNFEITNTSGADQPVDFLSKNATYTAKVNGATSAENDKTILLNDLATYQGTVKNGETQTLVLLFQFSEDTISNLTSVGLSVTVNGTTTEVAQ